MSELDNIRMRKLAEMQANSQSSQMQNKANEEAQFSQKVAQLEAIVKQIFTKEALERYGNIKAVDPNKALDIIAIVGQMVQTGKVHVIDDEMLKNLLFRLTPQKREIKINRA